MWGGGSRQEAVMSWALGSHPQDSSTPHAGPLSLIQERVPLLSFPWAWLLGAAWCPPKFLC